MKSNPESSSGAGFAAKRLGRLTDLVRTQLKQGLSPRQLSLTVAIGVALGLFPIMGTTTLLCFVAALVLRLNQPIIQAANWLVAWAQPPLILLFVRIGESLVGAEAMPLNPMELATEFNASPSAFLERFGQTGLHGILGWSVIAAPAAAGGAVLLEPAFQNLGGEQEGGGR